MLSASSSLSADGQWSNYNTTLSPKVRPSIANAFSPLLAPSSTRGKSIDVTAPRTRSPASFFVSAEDEEDEDKDENESHDDGHTAEDEYEDEDEDDDDGLFMSLPNKQPKTGRSHSISIAELSRSPRKAMERTDSIRPTS